MHPTHDWHSLMPEAAGWACTRCHACTCHSPQQTLERPCPERIENPDG